jgi:hypothetical protein
MTLPFETARIASKSSSRQSFIGGLDARIIMGKDEEALLQLCPERSDAKPMRPRDKAPSNAITAFLQ